MLDVYKQRSFNQLFPIFLQGSRFIDYKDGMKKKWVIVKLLFIKILVNIIIKTKWKMENIYQTKKKQVYFQPLKN